MFMCMCTCMYVLFNNSSGYVTGKDNHRKKTNFLSKVPNIKRPV